MRILVWLLMLMMMWSVTAREPAALFFVPGNCLWLEDPAAVARLEALFAARGVKVEYARDTAAYLDVEARCHPAWIVYAPVEVVPAGLAETLARQLRDGARLITGGGMPFWYEVGDDGAVRSADGGIGARVAGVRGVFVTGSGQWTELGSELTGLDGELPGAVRAIGAVTGDATLLALARCGDAATLGMVAYPGGGRLFFAGTDSLSRGPLNILAPDGEARWGRLLDWLAKPLPTLQFDVRSGREVILGASATPAAVTLAVTAANPSEEPATGRLRLRARRAGGFGRPEEEVHTGAWRDFALAPGETRTLEFELPVPAAAAWGVWLVECGSDGGMTAETPLHFLPPAAVEYLDVDPLLAAPGSERSFSAGVYGFAAGVPLRLLFERETAPETWELLAEREVDTVRGNRVVELPAARPERATRYRVRLVDRDGRDLHETRLRVSVDEDNPAFRRETVMFRALDGLQFASENERLFADLKKMQHDWPLFHGLQPARLSAGVRDWMRANGFLLNYGAMLNDIGGIERWGLADANAAGVSAFILMPGHCEDPALWLVRQNSRAHFADIVRETPEIANLVEAVPGYETPGLFDAATRGGGAVSHFFGYAPLGAARHWEALAAIDGGVRQLEPGGRRFRRVTLPELYWEIYNEAMPSPAEFGWSSWAEYQPLRLNQAQQHGALTAQEVKLFRLHYLIRTYYHLKRIDDLSAWLHQSAGEVHDVAHEGALIAQIPALTYRLPYVDTNTWWMFRSAWRHGWGVSRGPVAFMHDYSALFGHRLGLHEEIGGGQWASYRTAETSFVSVFVKRATVPLDDLQVDFYLGADRTYRVKEELAMYRGFQLAVDTGARPSGPARAAVASSSASYFPELKKGVIRDELFAAAMVSFSNLLNQGGIPYRTVPSPLVSERLLDGFELLFWASEHPMAGDLGVLKRWLAAAPGRTLVINHVGSWNCDYTGGFWADELRFDRSLRPLSEFGIETGAPEPVRFSVLNGRSLGATATGFFLAPPAGAEVLMRDDAGRGLVWRIPVERGILIYSGLPFGNANAGHDPAGVMTAAWSELLHSAGWRAEVTVTPKDWFVGTYRLDDGRLAVAAIHPGEAAIADRDYGADGDAVEQAAAALGETEVSVVWHGAAAPGSRWRAVDAWDDRALEGEFRAEADGTLKLRFAVPAAKLFFLEKIQ